MDTSFRRTIARAKAYEHSFMVGVSVVIGVLGGLGAVGFRWLIHALQRVGWGTWHFGIADALDKPWWWAVGVPVLGGAIVGPLVYFFAREAKGHGVPEVMEAVALRAGVIRPRLVVVKGLASAVSIASGGSVGREGPIVQIGSAIGSTIGQWLHVSGARLRVLVGCGAAAGIAATFNAPIAGPIFAAEVILGDFAVKQFSPIVISSVVATVVARAILGDIPSFPVPTYHLESPIELVFYLLLGIVAAIVGLTFVKVLYAAEDLADRLPIKPWLLTPIGFGIIGIIGLKFPHILGVGYEAINDALAGDAAITTLLILLGVKVLATSITIASGGSGGVFAPSLFLGAMTGGAVGSLAHLVIPGSSASSGAYALVGMGAVVAATTHAPLTAILILFELTSDYQLILPLMASCIIATLFATRVRRESIYTMKLRRRGVDIRAGREVNVLRSLVVAREMSKDCVRIPADETLGQILSRVTDSHATQFYVVEQDDQLVGVISLNDLHTALPDISVLSNLVLARDIARADVPSATANQRLDIVMRIFDGRNRDELPVVDDQQRLIGVISRQHLMDAYNRELMRRDMAVELSASVSTSENAGQLVDLGGGVVMVEIGTPGEFTDKTIRELDVRGRYGVQILLIRSSDDDAGHPPSPDTRMNIGDRLVVMGQGDQVAQVRAL